jgi:hypothetical protein
MNVFKFSVSVERPTELLSWFSHFVARGVACWILKRRDTVTPQYSLWREGEDAFFYDDPETFDPAKYEVVAVYLPWRKGDYRDAVLELCPSPR